MREIMTLWHGSSSIIEKPVFGYGKAYNDYGLGFYCTENVDLAKEWACADQLNGYANQYTLDVDDLNILKLSSASYTILNWLALLVENRQFQPSSAVAKQGLQYLKEVFMPDISRYDLIIGYRADDSYFSFARAFLNNTISLQQLSVAMRLGRLGEQIVLKSERAFDRIQFTGYEIADSTIYYIRRKQRDEDARQTYRANAELDDLNGLYMRDILREKVQNDDPRLR